MKTIITVGSGYSGSSAVYEYLRLTNLFFDPFPDKEFSLIYDPGGISDIENCLLNNFTPTKNKIIYDNFLENIKFYTSPDRGLKPGKNIKIKSHNLNIILKEYLNSITSVVYEGESNFIKFNNSRLINLYKKFLFKFNKRVKGKMTLFCDINDFEYKTKELFLKLFSQNNINKKDVILDQGGNIWRPYSSTKYFPNPKILIIHRDPRDIFSEFKTKTASAYPGNNVYQFCAWYENIISKIHISEYQNSNILKLNFEDFVLNNIEAIKNISNFLSLEIYNEKVNFDFNYSKKNIKRYKNNLSNLEIEQIENKLKKYLYNI
tara:strand:- start:371 stop:1327 length:957 start_codon:yes stop_codon:yes gene_type:complete